jgi:DOPA 4,5-dioxygenase
MSLMLSSEISSRLPAGFARDYDAHVYYRLNERARAERVRAEAVREFRGDSVQVGELRDEKLGPHPEPMFELNFPRRYLGQVLDWLLSHRESLTVLVHPVTGDDVRDHSKGAIWLGAPLPLDASRFDPPPFNP